MATIVTRSGKGSPLSVAEGDANFTNLNNDKIENIVEDTTPQLGGNLDVNGQFIVSVSNGNIVLRPDGTGKIVLDGSTEMDGNLDFTGFNIINSNSLTPDLTINTHATGSIKIGNNGVVSTEITDLKLMTDLDVNGQTITTTQANGGIQLSPNGTGVISLSANTNVDGHLTIQGTYSLQSSLNNDLQLNATGTGDISLTGTKIDINQPVINWPNGVAKIQAATSIDLNSDSILLGYDSSTTEVLLTTAASSNANLKIRGSGTGTIILDDYTEINGDFDLKNHNLTTSTTNGSINIQNNGTGLTSINGGAGLNISSGYLNTGTNTNLVLNPNGTGAVVVNATTSGMVVADTGASGYGSITGDVSTGLALSTNAGAQGATDAALLLNSGGGATLQAGSGSTLALSGNTVTVAGTVDFNSNIIQEYTTKNYKVSTYVPGGGSGVSGTYAPDWANGSYHYLVMVGNVTINDFGGTIEAGQVIQIIKDDTVVGGNTLTFGAKFLTPGGTISQTSSGMDLYEIACLDATSGSEVYIVRAFNNIQ